MTVKFSSGFPFDFCSVVRGEPEPPCEKAPSARNVFADSLFCEQKATLVKKQLWR